VELAQEKAPPEGLSPQKKTLTKLRREGSTRSHQKGKNSKKTPNEELRGETGDEIGAVGKKRATDLTGLKKKERKKKACARETRSTKGS